MLKEMTKFSGKLRENGIPASIRSTKMAYQAISLIEDNDRDLEGALACIYLKDENQRWKFNEVYDSFFEEKDVVLGDKQSSYLNISKKEKKSKLGDHYKIMTSISKDKSPSLIMKSETPNWRIDYIDALKDDLKQDYNEDSLKDSNEDLKSDNLLKNNLKTVNSLQPELIGSCQKLGRKIATKRSRRYKQSKKQKPDIRRTIRKNLKHNGTLLDLVKSKPKIKKHNHYFLSDVSVSCNWIGIWFFCMVYAAQSSFSKVRAFEFDNKTAEITSALHEPNVIDAFIKVLRIRQKNSMIHGRSNMFTAFHEFMEQADLNSKSYILLLSDCRDLDGPKYECEPLSADLIETIFKISKRVLILNPEPKNKWNVRDSYISYYEDAGAEVFEVRNLEQLADMISEI